MKIVTYGPERRTGAWLAERVIDLNRGLARQLREQGRSNAQEEADVRLPAQLLKFIELGAAGLEDAQRVIDPSSIDSLHLAPSKSPTNRGTT